MKIYNEQENKFENDALVQAALALNAVYASEIICYRLSQTLDMLALQGSFMQEKKKNLNEARRLFQRGLALLESSFDKTFDSIINQNEEIVERTNYIQASANEIVQLLLIFFLIGDGKPDKKRKMKEMLLEFGVGETAIDFEDLFKYYNF